MFPLYYMDSDIRFIFFLFKSVYPPMLSAGNPKRHHIVIYTHIPLREQYTSSLMQKRLKLDPVETGASVWLDRPTVEAIVETSDYGQTEDLSATDLIKNYKLKESIE